MFEKMKGMTLKQKIGYYIEYYGVITLVILAAIIVAITFIVQQVQAREQVAGVILVNSTTMMTEETKEQEYMNDLLASLDIDPDKNEIYVNGGIQIGEGIDATMAAGSIQVVQALIMSHSVDVAFTDESYRDSFIRNECLDDLRDYLDDEILEKYADDIIYFTSTETGEEIAAMIRVSPDSKWMQGMKWYTGDCYAGIIVKPQNKDVAVHMLLRALGEEEF